MTVTKTFILTWNIVAFSLRNKNFYPIFEILILVEISISLILKRNRERASLLQLATPGVLLSSRYIILYRV
jgi:hypothetical protein